MTSFVQKVWKKIETCTVQIFCKFIILYYNYNYNKFFIFLYSSVLLYFSNNMMSFVIFVCKTKLENALLFSLFFYLSTYIKTFIENPFFFKYKFCSAGVQHASYNFRRSIFKVSAIFQIYPHQRWACSAEERKSASPQVYFCCAATQT
jgi:hypothetical protein